MDAQLATYVLPLLRGLQGLKHRRVVVSGAQTLWMPVSHLYLAVFEFENRHRSLLGSACVAWQEQRICQEWT
jgi:hypothetical protein